ncbi:transcriptional regulator with XRE-family HTH domain [Paenibacillus sp. PastF-3]|uniref:helix-turn-helix domain-containing protein n=1 Tax=unclassified Paenibacillus TaxID=185978 RepID=UPI002476C225|nr:helix-turn-helix transcriptional regulator [Paenibacillus sp. PastF-3]MDH6371807.1 transcriptional regulator with XRE-family HTH domain [Paenibacillus sp. PastF-3]
MRIGQTLTELRIKKGWTQDQIAEELGIKRARYNAWENNIAKPDIEFVDKLAEIHKVSTDFILGRSMNNIPEWANSKDIKDFKKLLEGEGAIMFDGVPIDGESRQRVMDILTGLFWDAKKTSKEKFTNKRYKKDDN